MINKLFYLLHMVVRCISANQFKTLLLILCYAAGFLMPLTIFSYRDSVLDYYSEKPMIEVVKIDFNILLMDITDEQIPLLNSASFWEQFFIDNPEINQNVKINLQSYPALHSDSIFVDKLAVRANVLSTMPEDAGTMFQSSIPLNNIIGEPLSVDDPMGILVSSKVLSEKRLEDALGKEIYVNGRIYKVRGIVKEEYRQVYINMISQTDLDGYGTVSIMGYLTGDNSDTDKIYKLAASMRKELSNNFTVQTTANNVVTNKITAEDLRNETNSLLILSIGGLLFCICSSLGIMNAFISENEKNIRMKMEVGARKVTVFLEFFLYIFIVTIFSSAIAYALSYPVKEYMDIFFRNQLLISYRIFFLLFAVSLFTSVSVAFFAIVRVGRRLP